VTVDVSKGYDVNARWELIPYHIHDGLKEYLEHGIVPGSFLQAVLTNDLYGAVMRADETNINRLPDYMRFLHNYVDPRAFGNPRNVSEWIARRKQERTAA